MTLHSKVTSSIGLDWSADLTAEIQKNYEC